MGDRKTKVNSNNNNNNKRPLTPKSMPPAGDEHAKPLGRPHLTWMDTAMHDMGSLGRMLQIDLPRDWASLALHRDVWRGVVSRC